MSEHTRRFHIGDILSVIHDRLVSPDHIDGLYRLLGWMVNEAGVMTHQLPRLSRECEGFLRETFPDLSELDVAAAMERIKPTSLADIAAWFAELETDGVDLYRDVPRLPEVDHTPIDPLTELRMLRPDAEVIVVRADDES